MIDDVLKDIREAEEKSEALLKRAYQRGKEIVLKAEAKAEAEKKSTVSECKEDRAKILQHAREQADERTATILKRGAENAEYYVEEKQPAVEQCAGKVVEILLDKYIANRHADEQIDGQADEQVIAQDLEQAAEQSTEQPVEQVDEQTAKQIDGPDYEQIIQD